MVDTSSASAPPSLLCAILPGEASVAVLEAFRRGLSPADWTPSRAALPPLVPLSWLSCAPEEASWIACARALPAALTVQGPRFSAGSWTLPVEEADALVRARALLDSAALRPGQGPIPEMNAFWLGFGSEARHDGSEKGGRTRAGALQLALLAFTHQGAFWESFAWTLERRRWLRRSDE